MSLGSKPPTTLALIEILPRLNQPARRVVGLAANRSYLNVASLQTAHDPGADRNRSAPKSAQSARKPASPPALIYVASRQNRNERSLQ